jgi:hypothetical protein
MNLEYPFLILLVLFTTAVYLIYYFTSPKRAERRALKLKKAEAVRKAFEENFKLRNELNTIQHDIDSSPNNETPRH